MASDDLARLRAMVEMLPAGPWTVDETCTYDPEAPAWIPEALTVPTCEGDMMSAATCDAIAALRNVAPELLAVAEAAEQAVWEQTESDSAHRAHQALDTALDALRAKVPR